MTRSNIDIVFRRVYDTKAEIVTIIMCARLINLMPTGIITDCLSVL